MNELDIMNPTIDQACSALAPEDSLDFDCESGVDISKPDQAITLGRKLGCVTAGLKVVNLLCRALDSEDDSAPHMAKAEAYLAAVVAWSKKPSEKGEADVLAALERSDFVKPGRRTKKKNGDLVSETFSQPDYSASPLRKACYHVIKSCLAVKPSDSASYLANVAKTAARAIEGAAHKESGWAHARLVGIIQSEAL